MHSVYLIRHGKSSLDGEEDERGLEPEGIVHADQIASRLISVSPPIAAIYSSPYRRASSPQPATPNSGGVMSTPRTQ